MTDALASVGDVQLAGGLVDEFDGEIADELDGEVECIRIEQITHDVKTFEFRLCSGQGLAFAPGQYLTFRFPALGIDRCYTISSSANRQDSFTITVKRVAGGNASVYLHDVFAVGDVVRAEGPYGAFSTAVHVREKYLFLSGGSGITPMLSMARTLLGRQPGTPADIVFIHSARTPADIICRAELDEWWAQRGVVVASICSADAPEEAWAGVRGRITEPVLRYLVPDIAERETFVCGPAGYMQTVRAILGALGLAPDRHHEESFRFTGTAPLGAVPEGPSAGAALAAGPEAPPEQVARPEAPPVPLAGPAGGGSSATGAQAACFAVEFRSHGRSIECSEGTTVLAAAHEAGIPAASSCQEGVCGTCKSTLLCGEVEMTHAGGIRPREIKAGKFLPCCSTPKTDLVIE